MKPSAKVRWIIKQNLLDRYIKHSAGFHFRILSSSSGNVLFALERLHTPKPLPHKPTIVSVRMWRIMNGSLDRAGGGGEEKRGVAKSLCVPLPAEGNGAFVFPPTPSTIADRKSVV